MKETKTTYAYLIEHMTEPSFDKVRSIACDFVQKLPSELVDELHEMLNRGVDILDSEPLMQMYFYSYGCMHSEKLSFAFQNLNSYIKSAETVDLIDYGCGQGLATMCYHDYISENCPHQHVRSITLVEPSSTALARAELLCSCFFPDAVITAIEKPFDELRSTDIQIKGDIPTLHLFSNILDIESYNINKLSDIVKSSYKGDNEFVVVSPMQNTRRLGRLKEFVETLDANCYFEKYLDKQQLREDKDWTCAAILCSTRNENYAEINLEEVHKKVDELFDDILLRRDKAYAEKVFEEVKLCADNGDAKCMNAIGRFYNSGLVVEKDYLKAMLWYNHASSLGYLSAFRNQALLYTKGNGVKKDVEKAIEIANTLKDNNQELFYAILGDIYRLDKQMAVAINYYKQAAKLGDPTSEYHYGYHLCKGKLCERDAKLGVRYLRSAAKKGVKAANLVMARLYEFGADEAGLKQSDALAVKNYKIAARKGSKKAQLKLAEAYKDGLLGVNKNEKESFKWYLILAESGDNNVAFNVAYSYANGNGVEKSYEDAVKWYKVAVENGSAAAMNNLAVCYENGNGVEKNLETAFSLYYKSAESGNLVAANNLSICYQYGTGIQENPKEALIWKEKVATGHNSKAQATLAEWYFKGYGTERSHEKALYWFIRSKCNEKDRIKEINDAIIYIKEKANEEDAYYQYLLAKCYDYGIGLAKDKKEARFWYEASADNGFVESLIKLRRIDSLSTLFSEEERANGQKDEYGVIYSHDWKKVISCSFVHSKYYKIRKGTRIIADGAFNNQSIDKIVIPSTVIKIGENPFQSDPYYNHNNIKIENHSPYFITKGSALYSKDLETIIAYWGNDKHFVIPKDVKHIGSGCFSNSNSLEDITFPEGLESIGKKAFEDCYSLLSLDIPKSVKSIEESAFWGCEHLENVWSLGSVEAIEPNTFEGCNLKYIHLPSTLKRIGDNAFNYNIELRSIELPDSVEELGKSVFAYCYKLEHINLCESIRKIGDFCFYECPLKEVRLPSSLLHLGVRPFDCIENIITKPNSLFVASSGMLKNTKTGNLECYFGKESSLVLSGIKSFSPLAFYKSQVENVTILESVKVISEYAFYEARKIRSVSLPNQLEVINTGAFCECSNLLRIIIPESVKEIQSSSFYHCMSLKSIVFKGSKTKVSESIINRIGYNNFPIAYHSHCELMGSTKFDSIHREVDIDSLEVITVTVPFSAKDNYKFNPVYSTWDDNLNPMYRRFQIIESDEKC